MREAAKVSAVVVLLFAAPAAAVGWFDDRPNLTMNVLRYFCPVLCVLALGVFLIIHFRPDDIPDYLEPRVGTYFNRDGFCFGILPAVAGDVCVFDVYFQNQYEN